MMLVVITAPSFMEGETEAVAGLFDAGLERLHLRKPGASERELERFLGALPSEHLPKVVVHDCFSLKERFGLCGIHLNARNPLPPEGYEGSLSCSCHSLAEVEARQGSMDYLFLSPVFNSISKQGYTARFSPGELSEAGARGIINNKTVALGGVCLENLLQVARMGFGGAAFLGYIWELFERTRSAAAVAGRFSELRRIAGSTDTACERKNNTK